jgi:hypothetical protein
LDQIFVWELTDFISGLLQYSLPNDTRYATVLQYNWTDMVRMELQKQESFLPFWDDRGLVSPLVPCARNSFHVIEEYNFEFMLYNFYSKIKKTINSKIAIQSPLFVNQITTQEQVVYLGDIFPSFTTHLNIIHLFWTKYDEKITKTKCNK